MPEKLKGVFFSTHSVSKLQKIEGELLVEKNSHNAKKTERGPFSVARYCMIREKKEKLFLVQFPGPTGTI